MACLLLVASGCLWLPGYPPDKAEPDPSSQDPPGTTFCTPYAGPVRPVMIKGGEETRQFVCRIRLADSVQWTFRVVEGPLVNPTVLATGVESLTLPRSSLPWSTRPYSGELELRVQAGGSLELTTWPLLVLPHAEELFVDPYAAEEPESTLEEGEP